MSRRVGSGAADFWGEVDDDAVRDHYPTLVGALDAGFYRLDADGRFAAVTDGFVERTGYSRADLLGEHVSTVLDGAEVAQVGRAGSNGDVSEFDLAVQTADGSRVPVEVRVVPLLVEDEFHGTVGVVRDVAEQKQTDESLREREQQFQSLIEEVEEYAIFRLDTGGHVESWNAGARRIKGYDADEIMGEHFSQFYTEADREAKVPERNLARAAREDSVEDEGWRVRKDGTEFWANVTITAIHGDDGDLEGFAKVTRDMTERRERQRELREEKERFESLVDAVEEYAIFRLDTDGRVQSWNAGAERLKGYDADEIMGEHFSQFYTEADRAADIPGQNLARATREGSVEDEGWRVRKDGTEFWANVTITAVHGDDGDLEGFAKVTRDMTEHHENERQLQRERDLVDRILDAAPVGVVVFDADGSVTRINDRCLELLGVEESQMEQYTDPGFPVFDEAGRSLSEVEGPFTRALETEEPQYDRVVHVEQADGDHWFVTNAVPILEDDGVGRVVVTAEDVTTLKERELELESELGEILGRVSDAFYALDDEFRFTHVNERAEELLQHSEVELLGRTLWEVFPETEKVDEVHDAFRTAMETQETTGYELYFDPLDIWVEASVYPSESGLSVYFRDVTERQERERAIRENERRSRTLIDNFPDGAVGLFDEDLEYSIVGGELIDDLDLSPEEVTGKPIHDLYPEEVVNEVEPMFHAVFDGESSEFEIHYLDRDLHVHLLPVEEDGGDVFAGMITAQDVSERKEYQRKLQHRTTQQETIAHLGQLALETDDLDELLSEASRRVAEVLDNDYCKVLDLDDERRELLLRQGVGWQEGIVGSATVSADDNSQAGYTLLSEEPVVVEDLDSETRFSGPELLTSHDVTSGISTIIGSPEDPWGILGTHDTGSRSFGQEDVDFVQGVANVLAEAIERRRYQGELERLVKDLEESNERLEQFAYAASHDLQEPLRMVSSYLKLIDRRYGDALDENGEEYLEFAVDGADRMRNMIDGLLEYSRIETRGDPLGPVDLDGVLADARADLGVRIDESDAEITSESLPRVEGDENQLRQVFQNLLDNAIEYSGDEPPRVHVSAERQGSEWEVSVRDEGIGIDPKDADQVFEVFQHLHGGDEHSGTGIGLALCERIVERHGGDIWVESSPGEGSTFSFTLPGGGDDDE